MQSWLEPVALVAWTLLGLSWLLLRRNRRDSIAWGLCGLTVVYLFVATPLGANLLVGWLERPEQEDPTCAPKPADSFVVVLAGGMSGVPANDQEYSRLQEPSLRRTIEGVLLARQIQRSRLVLAGGGGRAVREADLMGSFAHALGFPVNRLIIERESRNTFENAREIARIVQAVKPSGRLYLVTSSLHMPRAAATFRNQGLDVCPYPVDPTWVEVRPRSLWVPQISALRKTTAAMHELFGYVEYWLTGRL